MVSTNFIMLLNAGFFNFNFFKLDLHVAPSLEHAVGDDDAVMTDADSK
jgi:hypothetical protein